MLGIGAALGVYAFVEPYRFRLQRHVLRVRSGAPRLTILHVSDAHLTGSRRDRARVRFIRSLPSRLERMPDLVLVTGDMIDDDSGIEPAMAALEPLRARLGCFYVLGSHDYFQARFKPPTRYVTGNRGLQHAPRADVPRLESGLAAMGWISLTNRSEVFGTPDGRIRLAGIDDPYLNRHRTDHLRRAPDEALAIGLMHAPDVVSEWALAGFDLVVAGHTHGGQVRLPGVGAIVTNSDLPAALAMGARQIGSTWLHVSPGVGTSKYTPVRFLTRPEATILDLSPGG